MIFQMNLAAVFTAAAQASWKRTKPMLVRDTVILPALGFLGIILLWWVIALFRRDLMPTPAEALVNNLDFILLCHH